MKLFQTEIQAVIRIMACVASLSNVLNWACGIPEIKKLYSQKTKKGSAQSG